MSVLVSVRFVRFATALCDLIGQHGNVSADEQRRGHDGPEGEMRDLLVVVEPDVAHLQFANRRVWLRACASHARCMTIGVVLNVPCCFSFPK